jgi:hypothetical protein
MAFKVGDKVKSTKTKNGEIATIISIEANGQYKLRWDDGMEQLGDGEVMTLANENKNVFSDEDPNEDIRVGHRGKYRGKDIVVQSVGGESITILQGGEVKLVEKEDLDANTEWQSADNKNSYGNYNIQADLESGSTVKECIRKVMERYDDIGIDQATAIVKAVAAGGAEATTDWSHRKNSIVTVADRRAKGQDAFGSKKNTAIDGSPYTETEMTPEQAESRFMSMSDADRKVLVDAKQQGKKVLCYTRSVLGNNYLMAVEIKNAGSFKVGDRVKAAKLIDIETKGETIKIGTPGKVVNPGTSDELLVLFDGQDHRMMVFPDEITLMNAGPKGFDKGPSSQEKSAIDAAWSKMSLAEKKAALKSTGSWADDEEAEKPISQMGGSQQDVMEDWVLQAKLGKKFFHNNIITPQDRRNKGQAMFGTKKNEDIDYVSEAKIKKLAKEYSTQGMSSDEISRKIASEVDMTIGFIKLLIRDMGY